MTFTRADPRLTCAHVRALSEMKMKKAVCTIPHCPDCIRIGRMTHCPGPSVRGNNAETYATARQTSGFSRHHLVAVVDLLEAFGSLLDHGGVLAEAEARKVVPEVLVRVRVEGRGRDGGDSALGRQPSRKVVVAKVLCVKGSCVWGVGTRGLCVETED